MDAAETAEALYSAWQTGHQAAVPSQQDSALDDAKAYAIQKAYVARRLETDSIAGFKVGATAQAVRQALGLTAPLTGVLLSSGTRHSGEGVALGDFNALLIETEIAFRAGSVIDAPIEGMAALKQKIPLFCPAFELAEARFFGAQETRGADLIASNAACASFICGSPVSWADVDPDAQRVRLFDGDEQLYEGLANETFGSQTSALLWLVNTMVAQGYRIEPGHIFLTGSLGRPVPGRVGVFRADYGPMGELVLDIR